MAKKRSTPIGQTIGGIVVGFDQQIFRSTPPVNELVAKGQPLRAVAADGGGTLSVGMPEPATDDADPVSAVPSWSADDDELRLEADGVSLVVDLVHGGRLASVVIDGRELLVTGDPDVFRWGCYPMAPYAGRVRDARFRFEERDYELPVGIARHAIHGTALHRRWTRTGAASIETDLGPDWPFRGRVHQAFRLEPGRLSMSMRLEAGEPMPASIGWHPWFIRDPGTAEPAILAFEAGAMFERDPDGVASRRLVEPPAPPWDDCFTDLHQPPVITWPGWLELTLASDAPDWVVYTEPIDALCVEPQTAPPGAIGLDAPVVVPDEPMAISMTWTWRSLAGSTEA